MVPWLEGVLLVGAMVLLAVGGTVFLRRWIGAETLGRNNEVAGFIYAVIGVVYAVLLGLSAIIVWEQYEKARAVVEQEANEIADLYRDSRSFPEAVRKELEVRLRGYAEAVVAKEWPAMAQRKASPEAGQAYEQIWLVYYAFQPDTDQQKIWYAESLRKLNDLGDQRRLRLLAARSEGVPAVMWVVLLGAGVITIGFSLLFGTRSAAAHLLMTGGVGITIGLVLLSIIAMHQPFSGIARVDTEAFDQTLEILRGGK